MPFDQVATQSAGPQAGEARIAITMQATFNHIAAEEAIAAGLFDIADQPGMIRLPVTLYVSIPGGLPEPPDQSGG